MIELLPLSEVNSLEVVLGVIFSVISLFIIIFLYQTRKFDGLFFGFLFFTFWNILEVLDEFVAKSLLRELLFNIFGRLILIVSLIILIVSIRKIPKKIYKSSEKSKKKVRKIETWIFFWIFLIIAFIINFTRDSFGLSNLSWHLLLHIGIIIFSFLILIHSLKLSEKAMKFVMSGCVLLILNNSILLLGHAFENYSWLETNIFTFLGTALGAFIIMMGFKEATNG